MAFEQFFRHIWCELEQQRVGLRRLGKLKVARFFDTAAQQLRHRVGVGGVLVKQIVVKVSDELRRRVPHFREQLGGLFAQVAQFRGQFGTEGDDRLGHHTAILGAAEADDIDPAVGGQRPDGGAEGDGRVGDTCSVQVKVHPVGVDKVGKRANFVGSIDGA